MKVVIFGGMMLVAMALAGTCGLLAGCGEKSVSASGPSADQSAAKTAAPAPAPTPAPAKPEAKVAPATAQTMCPVMGGKINKEIFEDYQGKRVYFCCGGCPAEFKKDPAKYVKAMEDKGIVLDKTP